MITAAGTEMGPINIYQIYADTCQPAISRAAFEEAHQMSRHGGPLLLGSALAAHGTGPLRTPSFPPHSASLQSFQ